MPTITLISRAPKEQKVITPVVLYQNGRDNKFQHPTGVKVLAANFDLTTGNLKPVTKTKADIDDARHKMKLIQSAKNKVEDFANLYYRQNGTYPSKAIMDAEFKNGRSRQGVSQFTRHWNTFIDSMVEIGKIKDASVDIYGVTYKWLLKWKPNLEIEDLTIESLEMLRVFMLKTSGRHKGRFITENSAALYLTKVKAFLRWAEMKNIVTIKISQLEKVSVKNEESETIFLTMPMLRMIAALEYDADHLVMQFYRDSLLCHSSMGLRRSDFCRPDKWNIRDGMIYVTAQKTGEPHNIPITPEIQYWLDKYLNDEWLAKMPELLGLVKYNRAIKAICKEVGLTHLHTLRQPFKHYKAGEKVPFYKLMSSHRLRATCICRMIAMGVPPDVIKGIVGIKSYEAYYRYVGVAVDTYKKASKSLMEESYLTVVHKAEAV